MDLLNTFLLFNISATVAILLGFFAMRPNAANALSNVGRRIAGLNLYGVAGAATSMVMLASLGVLFH